ncbi:MAG: hypothetical protein M3R27_03310, partial [Bacteroidota bacterium]|nr:hypothetical protein [Bacteroidota bacterium]
MNRRTVKIIAFFLIFICLWNSSAAQQLNIKNFTIEEGLPQSQILDLFQDKSGIIWLTTNGGGVSRFDGMKFHNYSTRDGLNNNRVYSVYEDNERILIGTATGLNSFSNNKISKVSDTLINQKTIYKIIKHSDGRLWMGTSSGIVIYDGKKFEEFSLNDSLGNFQVWSIVQDKAGNTWIATMLNGVFCYDGKKMRRFTTEHGLNDMRTRDILVNGDKIWIATHKGINTYDLSKAYAGGGTLDTLKVNGKSSSETTYRLYKDSSGVIWAGNSLGVTRYSYGKKRLITKANGLCNPMITGIIQDKEGNMWFGAFGGGVSKYRNDLFVNINESQGLTNNTVMSFFKDSKGNMWIGTWGGGVSKMDYSAWKNKDSIHLQNFVAEKEGLAFNNVWSICEDKVGNIWFGTSAAGVSIYDGKKFKNYDVRNGLHGNRIQALLLDKKGFIWIGTENGVDKWDGKTFQAYGQQQGFSIQGVNAIYEDKLGNLWFGSPDKIIKYDGKLFTTILRPEGFPRIRNIARDNYGYMWFSTDAGACVYNGKSFRMISEIDGLSSNTVYYVKPDDEGNLWLGTNNGIDKLDLNRFVNQKEVVLKHYGKDEGFIGLECNQNSFFKDDDGKLWIGTIGGVTIYDPKKEKVNITEAQSHITNIRLFLETVDLKPYSDSIKNGLPVNLRLPYDKNHVTFDFIAICQTIPGKVKYQFMLKGFDDNWLPEGKVTSTTYSNLPPGTYTFLLKASNNDGLWNKEPVSYTFDVVTPLWKRAWFYVLAIVMGIALILTLLQLRERSLKRSQKI